MRIHRFRAIVLKQGPNPYVDIPERLSRAFAGQARAGRIRVEGRLNRTPIYTVLVPRGQGRHRLYLNGGMRATAGVGVGDRVALALRPVAPDAIRLPADLVASLRRTAGARAAFDRLSLSHRRELLRYVDDARTPANRVKRLGSVVDQTLGRKVPPGRAPARRRPLWICPRCGHEFVNRNQWHSCKRHRLEDLFRGKPSAIRALFQKFCAMVESCGPVKQVVYRDHVGFMVRVRFARATPKRDWLDVGFWLPRRLDHRRLRRIETILPNAHLHLLRVTDPQQLDAQVRNWIRQAYAVGRQEHLR